MFEGYPNEYNQADPFNSFSNGMNEQQAWARQQEIYAAEQRAEEERKRREQEEKDNFWSNPIIDAKTARENREKNAMMYNLAEKSAEFNRGRDRKIGNTANRIVIAESAAQEKAAQAKMAAQETAPVDTAQTTLVEVSQAAPETAPVDVPEAAPVPAENEQTKQSEAAPIVAPAEQQPATGFDENGHPIDDVITQEPTSSRQPEVVGTNKTSADLPPTSTRIEIGENGELLFETKKPENAQAQPGNSPWSQDELEAIKKEGEDASKSYGENYPYENMNKFKKKVAAFMVAASAIILPLFGCAQSEPDKSFGTSAYAEKGTLPHNVGPNIPTDDYGTGVYEAAATQGETESKESGIIDGYNDAGMFGTVKDGTSFADAEVLSKEYGNDEEVVIEVAGRKQAESLADYIVNMPDGIKPAWAKGMTELEAESYIEGLDAKDYDEMYEKFTNDMDKGLTRTKILNGRVANAYMRVKDPSKPLTHENVELVCYEEDVKDLEVTEFYWLDENGNEIGSMMFKIARVYDENGNIVRLKGCTQVINPQGSPVYAGMPVIEKSNPDSDPEPEPDPNPDPEPEPEPDPTPEPTPTPGTPTDKLKQKDEKAEIANAGPRAEQQEQTAPVSTWEEEQQRINANQAGMSEQAVQEAQLRAIYEQKAREQAERQRIAAEEAKKEAEETERLAREREIQDEAARAAAEWNRQQADAAANNNDSAAVAAQQESASAEQAAAEARQQAQNADDEADRLAEEMERRLAEQG